MLLRLLVHSCSFLLLVLVCGTTVHTCDESQEVTPAGRFRPTSEAGIKLTSKVTKVRHNQSSESCSPAFEPYKPLNPNEVAPQRLQLIKDQGEDGANGNAGDLEEAELPVLPVEAG